MATLPLLIYDHSPSADSTLTVRRKWVAKREPSARNAAPAMAHIDVMWRSRLWPCAHTPFDGNAFDNAHRRAEIGRRGREGIQDAITQSVHSCADMHCVSKTARSALLGKPH